MIDDKINKLNNVRVRIAPSPTGPLHIGTARTALFNYLFAKHFNGVFVLRIEDTDLERSDRKYEKDIIEHLKWLGIVWDEGVEIGGKYAPYRQSERIDTYSKYIQQLLDEGKAFYCFHSKEELEKERQEQMKQKQNLIHICSYRGLVDEKIKELMVAGNYIIRFSSPKKKVKFNDLIRGELEFDSSLLGDFSIAKDIRTPLYNFAVVIDDFEMKISHIIRGEDHISNTPKQILLQEALGFPSPEYAHLPLILNPDRSKMSKRYLDTSVADYRRDGYLSEALVNFIVLLGWNPGSNKEFFSLKEMMEEFSIEKIQKSGAVFNVDKLNWMNGYYIHNKGIDELTELCQLYFPPNTEPVFIKKILSLEKERMQKLSDIKELACFFMKDALDYEKYILRWKDMTDESVVKSLKIAEFAISRIQDDKFSASAVKDALDNESRTLSGKGELYWPLRVALSGLKNSPPPQEIAEVLGKEKTVLRINEALRKFDGA